MHFDSTGLNADKFHSSCDNILDFIATLKSLVTGDPFVIVSISELSQ